MRESMNQQTVDNKIHHFLNTKSPWRTFSKSVAEHFTPARRDNSLEESDISYEQLDWNRSEAAAQTRWQKAS